MSSQPFSWTHPFTEVVPQAPIPGLYWSAVQLQSSPSPKRGVLVAKSNQSRPNMVNLEGFSYGMTQFIKIPEQGRTVALYNPMMKDNVECTLINSEEHPIDDYRRRWVIVQLKRHTRYKRALRIVGFPQ